MLKKKIPFILGVATATAGAFTGAMVSIEPAHATPNESQPAEEQPAQTKTQIDSLVVNEITNQAYTGNEITPPVYILDAQKQLELDTDYSLTYSKNTNVGIADVLITGKGEYDGTKTIHFNIIKATNSWEIEPDIETMSVGKPKFGEVRLFIKASGAEDSTYIEMIIDEEEGIYPSEDDEEALMEFFFGGQSIVCKIVVDGNDNYTGLEKLITMTIPYNVSVQNIEPVQYTGNAIEPTVYVYDDDTNEQLTLGVDYLVEYSSNINAGIGLATISFIGDYIDVEPIEQTFVIEPIENSWTDTVEMRNAECIEGGLGYAPSLAGEAIIEYKVAGADDSTYTQVAPIHGGNYIMRATVPATQNYTGLVATVEFSIQAKQTYLLAFEFSGNTLTKYKGNLETVILPTSYSLGDSRTVTLESGSLDLSETYNTYYQDAIDYQNMTDEQAQEYAQEQMEQDWQVYEIDYKTEGYWDYNNVQVNKAWNGKVLNWSITYEEQDYIEGNDYQVTAIASNIMPNNVTGNYAIVGSNITRKIVIPEGYTEIGAYAFGYGSFIEEIVLPTTMTTINPYAFSGLSGLSTINAELIQTPVEGMFVGTGFTEFVIPEDWTIIPTGLFSGCNNLENVVLHDNITSIGNNAFSNCSNLNNFIIPSSVETIGSSAFIGTGFEEIVIPASVNSIGSSAFQSENLRRIIFESSSVVNFGLASMGNISYVELFQTNPGYHYSNSYDYVTKNLAIYVPQALLNDYRTTYASVNLNFKAIGDDTVTVTALSIDSEKGTVSGSDTYYIGDEITLYATPQAGHYFEYWIKDGSERIYTQSVNLTLTGVDLNFVAYFKAGTKVEINGHMLTVDGGTVAIENDNVVLTAINTENFVYWKQDYTNLGEQTTITIPISGITSDMLIIASDGFIEEQSINFAYEYESYYYDALYNQSMTDEQAQEYAQEQTQNYYEEESNLSMYFSLYEYDDVYYSYEFDWSNQTVTVRAYGKINNNYYM